MEEELIKIKEIVQKELSCSAHNMDHVLRVYNLAGKIALAEKEVDMQVLKMAVLLHDIARVKEDNDPTGKTDHALLGAEMAGQILKEFDLEEEKIKHVQDCIISHRYRTGNKPETIEAQILFDADKLDTVGAIGIARAFVWVGRNNAKIYSNVKLKDYIKENLSGKINGRIQDKTKHSLQIEFETKLKYLEGKIHTHSAKEICRERLRYLKDFLDRLESEINGKF